MEFNKYAWSLYKQSKEWEEFRTVFDIDNIVQNEYAILRKFNRSEYSEKDGDKEEELHFSSFMEMLWVDCVCAYYDPFGQTSNNGAPKTIEDAGLFWSDIINHGAVDASDGYPYIDKGDYRTMLGAVVMLSFLCYYVSDEFFFPYMFRYRSSDLYKIADTFDIELPPLPKKPDFEARCMYYWELCKVMYSFRTENDLSPLELCAFLYDYAPSFIHKDRSETPLGMPSAAWCVGGLIDSIDIEHGLRLWQGSPETKRGDILIHYETAPVSAITHIWRSQTDGVIDPFFKYYATVYLADGTEIPPITLQELREDPYFSRHPLIRRSFQGVNGYKFSGEDYENIQRILRAKGFDTDKLPQLYIPRPPRDVQIKNERDVERELLEYYLAKMGLTEGKEYIRQVPIQSGRRTSVYPDYVLGYVPEECKCTCIIEAKYHMKGSREVSDAFSQARSYALILQAKTMILCDKENLIVYAYNGGFFRDKGKRYYWADLQDPDVFQGLKAALL